MSDARSTRTGLPRLAVFLLVLLCVGPALAAQPHGAAPPAAPAMTAAQAQQALEVLNDPKKRAEVIATLEAIAHAHPAGAAEADAAPAGTPAGTPAGAPPAAPAPATLGLPLAPDSLGAAVLLGAANFMNQASMRIEDAVHTARGLPALWGWVLAMATNPLARALLADIAWRLALALAVGAAAQWAIGRTLRRPLRLVMRRLARRHPMAAPPPEAESGEARAEQGETEPPGRHRVLRASLLRRLPAVLGRIALELVPVLGFVVAGHVIAASPVGGSPLVRVILLAALDSTALCMAVLCLARALLSPRHRRVRLLPVSSDTAHYAMRWIRRFLLVGVFGYAIAEVGLLLGLSREAHLALLKCIVLILHVFLGTIVVQKRRVVRGWIRAPEGARGLLAALRNSVAAIWHWVALFYLAAIWLVWALSAPAGYEGPTRVLLAILLVVLLARLASRAGIGAVERLRRRAPDLATKHPGIEGRIAFYQPFLLLAVRVLVTLAAAILLLQLLGFGAIQWLVVSPLGRQLSGSLSLLAVTLLLALAVWEAVNAAIERHLARLTREGQIARTARLRTLLPILRTALLVGIVTVIGLTVLSEIGVNTTPLLASAGIIGVAIGFGSQKLVQDLITGLFLLMENAMQVGDWVTVSGLSGTVEHLSVRTIQLRADDGSVHIIPFSAVTSVTNTNRGLGNARVSVIVAYHEDTDRVCAVLRDVADEMRGLPEFAAAILSELQLWGVDRVDGASVTITGQIRCTDTGRWNVQREFNRRVKKRFEELGIAMFDPTLRLMVPLGATDGSNTAAPLSTPDVPERRN